MKITTFTFILGLVFVSLGILAFFPVFLGPLEMEDPELLISAGYGRFLNMFPVNALHNLTYIVLGIWALGASTEIPASKRFNRAMAWAFAVSAIMGFIPRLDTLFGLMPLHSHTIWLRALFAVGTAYFGYVHTDVVRPSTMGAGRLGGMGR